MVQDLSANSPGDEQRGGAGSLEVDSVSRAGKSSPNPKAWGAKRLVLSFFLLFLARAHQASLHRFGLELGGSETQLPPQRKPSLRGIRRMLLAQALRKRGVLSWAAALEPTAGRVMASPREWRPVPGVDCPKPIHLVTFWFFHFGPLVVMAPKG